MRIKGTFLDEISHDIPHQNWGEAEWDRDFGYMREAGIDTVILIRCGYRRWQTFPSRVLTAEEGCYEPPVDLVDMFLSLAEKYGMRYRRGVEPLRALQILCGMVYFAGVQPQYRQDRRSVCESGTLLQGGFRRSSDHDFPLY